VAFLVNTFPQALLEVLHYSLQHVGRNCCHFFPDVLFQIHRCPWFRFVHLALEISSEEEVLRLGTLVPMNIEVPTKYSLSHDRIVFEMRLHSKSPMLYRLALHDNWNALSLASRALKDKFSTPTVPLTTVLQNRQVFLPGPICAFVIISRWILRRIRNVSDKSCRENENMPFIFNNPPTPRKWCCLTHCGRVTQICVFNTVKLGTSASSP